MIEASSVDWTEVLVALIAGLPAILAAVFAYLVRRQIQTPSGDTLGAVSERTHDMTSANLALSQQIQKQTNGPAK